LVATAVAIGHLSSMIETLGFRAAGNSPDPETWCEYSGWRFLLKITVPGKRDKDV
jgi:hypothetical protein